MSRGAPSPASAAPNAWAPVVHCVGCARYSRSRSVGRVSQQGLNEKWNQKKSDCVMTDRGRTHCARRRRSGTPVGWQKEQATARVRGRRRIFRVALRGPCMFHLRAGRSDSAWYQPERIRTRVELNNGPLDAGIQQGKTHLCTRLEEKAIRLLGRREESAEPCSLRLGFMYLADRHLRNAKRRHALDHSTGSRTPSILT